MTTYQLDAADKFAPTEAETIDIETLVKSKLLPLPGSATRILKLVRDVNVTSQAISEAIGYDPVLASRVLRLANSPMYSMEREITSIGGAVSAIGVRSVYDIVMLGIAADSFSNDLRSMKTGVTIWEHCVATGLAARSLSKLLKLRGTEETFTCGLLHDIGKNLLYQFDPIRYTETESASDDEGVRNLEKLLFGYDHAQVGFYVSKRWGLAEMISSTILHHDKPHHAPMAVAACHVVKVADDLVTAKGMGLQIGSDTLPNNDSVRLLELTPGIMEAAWTETESTVKDLLDNC